MSQVMKLAHRVARVVAPVAPFNFDATFHKPAHFPSGDNFWEPGVRWQTFRWEKESLGVVFRNKGADGNPAVSVEVYSDHKLASGFVAGFINEITYRYNLNLDLKAFYKFFVKDKALAPAIKHLYGMRPGHQDSLYEYLIISIVLQNCTVRRSIQMMQVLFEKYGTLLEYGSKKFWCFWDPGDLKNITEEELRSLKIGYRAKFVKKIDDQFTAGTIDEMVLRQKDLEAQKAELLKLYGVGPATVWYLLFDVFHQYNFFSHISPWEQKIYSKIFFNREPENPVPVEKLLECFEKYGEYRQLAVNYLWEDLWWQHKKKPLPWLAKLVRQ